MLIATNLMYKRHHYLENGIPTVIYDYKSNDYKWLTKQEIILYKKILSLYSRCCTITLHKSKIINEYYNKAVEYIAKLFNNELLLQETIDEEQVNLDEELYIKTNNDNKKCIFSNYRKIATMKCNIEKEDNVNSYI